MTTSTTQNLCRRDGREWRDKDPDRCGDPTLRCSYGWAGHANNGTETLLSGARNAGISNSSNKFNSRKLTSSRIRDASGWHWFQHTFRKEFFRRETSKYYGRGQYVSKIKKKLSRRATPGDVPTTSSSKVQTTWVVLSSDSWCQWLTLVSVCPLRSVPLTRNQKLWSLPQRQLSLEHITFWRV